MTPLDVRQVLGDVGDAAAAGCGRAPRRARRSTSPPDLPPVRGDRVQLQQVLLNLILNGMDALEGRPTGRRSVTVSARREAPDSVEISVTDTGRGIAAGQIDRIFDPFFTTKTTGHRHGAVDLAQHRRGPWRPALGGEQRRGRARRFRFTLPVGPGA